MVDRAVGRSVVVAAHNTMICGVPQVAAVPGT
jgi:hypothetical protein